MILFTIFIMHLGYKQGNLELQILGIGLPLWMFLLIYYLKLFNRIKVEKDLVRIKNIIFGQKEIHFKDIEQWEEVYTISLFARNLLLRADGKKIILSNMIDKKNFKILHERLSNSPKQTE
jgi:hypothetical protein